MTTKLSDETERHLQNLRFDPTATQGYDAALYFEQLARDHAALTAERDTLHAALAWRSTDSRVCERVGAWFIGYTLLIEEHDGWPAGRAAALVGLWERCR